MEKWEYLDIMMDYGDGHWVDSSGEVHQLDRVRVEQWKNDIIFAQTLLTQFGDQNWELAGINNNHLIFKRLKIEWPPTVIKDLPARMPVDRPSPHSSSQTGSRSAFMVSCPYCRKLSPNMSKYCAHCGKEFWQRHDSQRR
jgi:hypothetical protein